MQPLSSKQQQQIIFKQIQLITDKNNKLKSWAGGEGDNK